MKGAAFAAFALLTAACQAGGGDDGAQAVNETASQGSAGGPGTTAEQPETHLLQALSASADHKTLANAVNAAGLTETLSGAQPYSLFAPDDAAFQKLPAGTVNGLLAPEAKGKLIALLTAHIVPGVVTAADLGRAIERGKGKAQLATVGGGALAFTRSGDSILVSDGAGGQARMAEAEGLASNGVIHSLDGVLTGRR
jgi:uncharacterized surface protein with fasciclin (FAS1) repeats